MSVYAQYTQDVSKIDRGGKATCSWSALPKSAIQKAHTSIKHHRQNTAAFPIQINWEELSVPTQETDSLRRDRPNTKMKKLFHIHLDNPFYLDSRSNELIRPIAEDTEFPIYYRIAKVYLDRFQKETQKELNCANYLPALRMIALSVTIKSQCDEAIWNREFIDLFDLDLTIQKFNRLERVFLNAIKYELDVDLSEMHSDWFKQNKNDTKLE